MKIIPAKLPRVLASVPLLVDDGDYDFLNQTSWFVHFNDKGRPYFRTQRKIDGKLKNFLINRLIMGNPKGMMVDHRNGNVRDNQRQNLRLCTHKQNCWNFHTPPSGKTSKFYGVKKRFAKWAAIISDDSKTFWLGTFNTELEAARVYNQAARLLRGSWAKLNPVD